MTRVACLVLASTLAISAQSAFEDRPAVSAQTAFEDRPAFVLTNGTLDLTVLIQGGTLASVVLRDDAEKLNPFWNPARFAREAGRPRYQGTGMGHFVCVDGFGGTSEEERKAGLPGHGEAHNQTMDMRSFHEGNVAGLTLAAKLPVVEEVFTRTIRMVEGEKVVYVESNLESLLGFDRPVCWAEHATIGSPFLEAAKTVVDMPARRAKTRAYTAGGLRRLRSFEDFEWPMAPGLDGTKIDMRPAPSAPALDHTTCLIDPSRKFGFVTALNTEKRLLLGYVFKRDEYPWLQNWGNYPPDGRMARGIEFSTQPFDVPRREVIDLRSMFDAPVYRWLPAKSRVGTSFLLFYTRVPEGFRKVDEVTLENGTILIEDRGAGKRVTLKASRPL